MVDPGEAADEILALANKIALKHERLTLAVLVSTGTSCFTASHEAMSAINASDRSFESTPAGQAFKNITRGNANQRDAVRVFVIDWGPEVLLKHFRAIERLVDRALGACD